MGQAFGILFSDLGPIPKDILAIEGVQDNYGGLVG